MPQTEDTVRRHHHYRCLSTGTNHFRSKLLRPLLIERVSGTKGNVQAREHIIRTLQATDMWTIELDTFSAMTSKKKQVEFTNIVATLNPRATRRIVLACHHDSKELPGFIGATDSAVPCAILLDIAVDLQKQLAQQKLNVKLKLRVNPSRNIFHTQENYPTLQLIFFDGEEAFGDWSSDDSLYGSKHLATKMRHTNVLGQHHFNQIEAIDVFVLLDLIGDKSLKFSNFVNLNARKYYNQLQEIETQLIHSYDDNEQRQRLFSSESLNDMIEDDQTPFSSFDIPILHLISNPFPPTWHKISDDEIHLDFSTIDHFRNIIKIFLQKNLHLKQHFC
ncbi:unnamed protein product [Adineta ricciae]|uniref:glutaminyl-peptide cyclotransferase n=1 Tax=Adineta ricciae TaxID=249248 RepID=A0A813S1N5_ADIRI|nr:unnamed protein product [Adineta ricciae]